MSEPSHLDTIAPDHHAEMEAHYASGMERQEAAYVLKWLADQMCRMEEPLIGSFSNSLSRSGLDRLGNLMALADQPGFSGAGLKGIRGSRSDIDLVQHWQNEAIRADCLAKRLTALETESSRLREALDAITSACAQAGKDAAHNHGTVAGSRRPADQRSAAYCEGILRVTDAVARLARKTPA